MKLYTKLANELMERNLDQNYLARKLDICVSSICDRLSGKAAWSVCEQLKVMDLMREPYDLMDVYFQGDTSRCDRMQSYAS